MSGIYRIEVSFPCPVELPDGWERTLDSLLDMVCKAYEKENPERVMWPAGSGAKPIWREPEEPEFDPSVYFVEMAEREDLYGENVHNPRQAELREKARGERLGRRAREDS